jgi:NADPH2:quinone reductase
MFTRPLSEPGSTVQREILDEVSRLVDAGELRTTETRRLQGLTAATLREAHRLIESGGTVGKIVVER